MFGIQESEDVQVQYIKSTLKKYNYVGQGRDGGNTWINQEFDLELPEPRCQGSLLSMNIEDKNIMLFSNPADANSRENMTLSISYDDGFSWAKKLVIYSYNSAYSDLTQLANGDVFVFYEAGFENPYEEKFL